ncbi:FAST kinase domain-containing protein 5, mitochondrial [Alosa pseudoharengus]|uniref:FAST kinase domain-containing protein 5, mitochondrial n=1 Tax=Alosa pseudoharengus TaxID=34774 RepID=UPI003F89D591
MSARVLSRRLARLYLHATPRQAVAFVRGRSFDSDNAEKAQQQREEEDEEEDAPSLRLVGQYTLQYNPSAYYRPVVEKSVPQGQSKTLDESPQLGLAPALRQQSNIYSISSSRHLSITKNTLLDLAFSRDNGAKDKAATPLPSQDIPPDVQVDPRAFQLCRPEYRSFTHDLSSRPPTLPSKQTSLILHKVTVLKGSMMPADIARFLCDLGALPAQQMPLVRGDSRFYMLLRYSVESLQGFTNVQLLDVLRALVLLGLPPTHSMLEIYEAEFVRRAAGLELHQLLLAADLWRCLGRTVTRYLERLGDCISVHFCQVGAPELVELVYLLGEGRRCPSSLLQPLEYMLVKHLDKLHPEEVGALCLGLFKAQCGLSGGAVRRLVDRALGAVGEMSDFALVNVMKLLRFSHLDHVAWLEAMGTEIPRRAPRMGVQGLMHVVLACSALHYRNSRILLPIAKRVPDIAPHCRSKDACKMLWAFGTLGLHPRQCPGLYATLTEVLRQREADFQRYPEHLLTALLGLAFAGQFPHDLLALALSPEFVSRASASQRMELRMDLFTLDGTVGLELPQWTGPRLGASVRDEVTRLLWDFAREDVCRKPEVLEAEAALQELLGGERFIRKHMILPHTRSIDLEVRLDPQGRPLPLISEEEEEESRGDADLPHSSVDRYLDQGHSGVTLTDDLLAQLTNTRKPPTQAPPPSPPPLLRNVEPEGEREGVFSVGVDLTDGLLGSLTKPRPQTPQRLERTIMQIAVQVSNRNHYGYRSQQLLGLHALKRRQLALAGYHVVELPHWEWFPLLRRSRTEKLAYLHCKIFGSLKE